VSRDLRQLTTDRMTLEAFGPEHVEELLPLLNDPLVARTLSPTGLPPCPGAEPELVQIKVDHWNEHGFGLWFMRDSTTSEMIGRGGIQHTEVEGAPEIELAWAIIPERWREGLATELARTCVTVAFDDLGLDDVVAFTLPHNVGSRGVMEKIGMRYERDVTFKDLPHVLYRLHR
jgi:RimJ/RimL family protein N-acetyltransferase